MNHDRESLAALIRRGRQRRRRRHGMEGANPERFRRISFGMSTRSHKTAAVSIPSGRHRPWRDLLHGLARTEMRQIVALRERIFASVGANVACSSVIILLLVAGNPTLQACDGGTVVPDPGNNPGLIKDCRVLLGLRDELGGAESLNWNTGLSIFEWNGVRVSGSPSRVTVLDLDNIAGGIPAELRQLTQLEGLDLQGAGLTGEIPAELGQVARLEYLDLSINELTGAIPVELGQLSQLRHLRLSNNELTGEIPLR